MENLYKPPGNNPKQVSGSASRKGLFCPRCNSEFELTWRKYLKAPFGRHTCGSCGGRFKLKHTLKYYLVISAYFLFLVLASLVVDIYMGETIGWIFYIIGAVLFLFPDKKLDGNILGDIKIVEE